MSGPTSSLKKGWDLIATKIKIDKPMVTEKYLGCTHVIGKTTLANVPHDIIADDTFRRLLNAADAFDAAAPVATLTYDMSGFLPSVSTTTASWRTSPR